MAKSLARQRTEGDSVRVSAVLGASESGILRLAFMDKPKN